MRSNTLLLSACLAVLVLVFAGAAFASPAPAPAAAPGESDALSLPTCAADFDFSTGGEEAPLCRVEFPGSGFIEPVWMVTFHKFCRRSCSHVPNCNASADCGGSPCLAGITCC